MLGPQIWHERIQIKPSNNNHNAGSNIDYCTKLLQCKMILSDYWKYPTEFREKHIKWLWGEIWHFWRLNMHTEKYRNSLGIDWVFAVWGKMGHFQRPREDRKSGGSGTSYLPNFYLSNPKIHFLLHFHIIISKSQGGQLTPLTPCSRGPCFL